jgi:aminoglycoside 6'-N-acetyltransferase
MAATAKPAATAPAAAEHSQGLATAAATGPAGFSQGQPAPIRLRSLTVADLPLLSQWFAAPHVERWWHESSDPALVRAEYLPCIEGSEPSHALIAELPTDPFGADPCGYAPFAYAQWYRWSDYPDHARSVGADPDEAGFDYFIGPAGLCGQGLGTRLIAALVELVRDSDASVAGFVVDPEVANAASRRVLEKNGFELVAVKDIPDPDGRPIGPTAVYRRRLVSRQLPRSVGDLGGS